MTSCIHVIYLIRHVFTSSRTTPRVHVTPSHASRVYVISNDVMCSRHLARRHVFTSRRLMRHVFTSSRTTSRVHVTPSHASRVHVISNDVTCSRHLARRCVHHVPPAARGVRRRSPFLSRLTANAEPVLSASSRLSMTPSWSSSAT